MGILDRVDKPCEDCGVMMRNVAHMRKICHDCAKKRAKKNSEKYRMEHPTGKTGKKIMSPISNPNEKYCKDCYYWTGINSSCFCCNYIFYENRKRPCPPGEGCTVKRRKRR